MEQKSLKKTNLKFNIYTKFIGFLTKKGKKSKAKFLLDTAVLNSSRLTKTPLVNLFFKIFWFLKVYIELKQIRVKRSKFFVPFAISLKRRQYLILKWFLKAVNEEKQKISAIKKMSNEFTALILKQHSKVLNYKKINNKQSLVYRSNLHFRW